MNNQPFLEYINKYINLTAEEKNISTNEELNFLNVKGAKVIGVETNHYNIWKRVVDSLRAGAIKL